MLQDERLIELISGSLDGVLTAEESLELETALASSEQARGLMAEMTSDQAALRALPSLQAPANLKQRALWKARSERRASGGSWQGLLMAASLFLAVGITLHTFRPLQALRLHLRPGQLATRAAEMSEELSLAAESANNPHVLLSDSLSGRYNGGPAQVHFQCDAGQAQGAKVRVAMAFDFTGDGAFDKHTQPKVMEVDSQEGYQEMACTFPPMDGMKDLEQGRVQVELSSGSEKGPPLKVKFAPDRARLDLPFDPVSEGSQAAAARLVIHTCHQIRPFHLE